MNNKYKIVALFGPAGSGKDYIQKKIMNTHWGKNNLHEIISYTTRPPRENEVDGVHYYFITNEHFMEKTTNKKMLGYKSFRGWYYGTSLDNLDINKINIGVFNKNEIEAILKREDCEILPIFIYTYDKLRLMRQLVREINPDCYEICRRFQTDREDFLDLPFTYTIIENNTDELSPLLSELILIIEDWSKKDK